MSKLWALLPLKDLSAVKTRLADTLDAPARRELVLAMARDVATALVGARAVSRVVLVSDIPDLPRLLGVAGVTCQLAAGVRGLNGDLTAAAGWAERSGARHVLIAHGDLPLLTADAVDRFVTDADLAQLRAACCHQGSGTNLLLAPLPLALPLVFGRDSLTRFRREAKRAGLGFDVRCDPALATDVDNLADYVALQRLSACDEGWCSATASMLREQRSIIFSSHA